MIHTKLGSRQHKDCRLHTQPDGRGLGLGRLHTSPIPKKNFKLEIWDNLLIHCKILSGVLQESYRIKVLVNILVKSYRTLWLLQDRKSKTHNNLLNQNRRKLCIMETGNKINFSKNKKF